MPSPNDSSLELAPAIRTAVSRLMRQFKKKGRNAALSMTERSTLGALDLYGTLLPSELAEMEKITAQSMTQILNNLSGLGYIQKKTSEQDKRKVFISLSTMGRAALAEIRHETIEWLAGAMTSLLTAKEMEVLKEAAPILYKLADFNGSPVV
ncbi:MAG: MarR family transcriptional regulator [Puia sp.]|nr:MarR family transcriptional regulator [Puia sp.]